MFLKFSNAKLLFYRNISKFFIRITRHCSFLRTGGVDCLPEAEYSKGKP